MIGYLTQNHPLIHAFTPVAARRPRRAVAATNRLIKQAPKLSDLLPEDEITIARGPLDRPISGLAIDSRRVVPGAVFFALPGGRVDSLAFVDEAVRRGAVAVVVARLPSLLPARVTFIQVTDVRVALAAVAQRFYQFPDRAMSVVAVTGGAGKTSVAHLLKHLLNGDQAVGLMSSIHYALGARTVPSFATTPESLDVYGMLAQMREAGCRHAVLEVTPSGLEQQRVRGVQWGAVVFTGLNQDGFANAGSGVAAWRRLGPGRAPAVAVVKLDDDAGGALAGALAMESPGTRVVTYGVAPGAQVRAENIRLGARHSAFRLVWPGGLLEVESPLVGRGQVDNLLAAVAAAWGLGRDPLVVLARLRAFPGVPGRLEHLEEGQAFAVVVDSAATAASLRRALDQLRAVTPGRLLVVYGCGGDRDRAARPAMTRAVQERADFAVATADNPRGEPLAQIFADMRAGVVAPERITWVENRRCAINVALDLARPRDCVLIAGKGNETFQIHADTVVPFDDRQVARELIRGRNLARET